MSNFNIKIDIDKIIERKGNLGIIVDVIEKGVENGINEFAERLVDVIVENLNKYGLGDSKLVNAINVVITDEGISIMMNSEYALFVEYGTGIVGLNDKHPKFSEHGWEYDVNNHGEEGWWYPTVESDPNPTKRYTESGIYAWTKGMRSRPFMYDSWLWGTRSVNNIINKHIRRELEKLEG